MQIIENIGASVNIYYTLQFQMIGNEKIIVVEFHSCVECSDWKCVNFNQQFILQRKDVSFLYYFMTHSILHTCKNKLY